MGLLAWWLVILFLVCIVPVIVVAIKDGVGDFLAARQVGCTTKGRGTSMKEGSEKD